MKKSSKVQEIFSPFMLVILLTVICIFLGVKGLSDSDEFKEKNFFTVLEFWRNGFFGLLGFTLQMMMILVFGYCLAIYRPIYAFLRRVANWPNSQVSAVFLIGSIAMLAGLLNWGFGLIAGALLARFVAVRLKEKGQKANAALLASSGSLGMAVWHGGFSGSAPLKIAEKNHFLIQVTGVIPIDETILSSFNIWVTLGLMGVFLLTIFLLALRVKSNSFPVYSNPLRSMKSGSGFPVARIVGLIMLMVVLFAALNRQAEISGFFDLNLVNFALFALVLIAFRSLDRFTESVGEGIKSSVDIFIQFPFYAGILGVLSESGVLGDFSNWIYATSSADSLPMFSLMSAAAVNFFVPSGGGQWAVQGPVIMEAAKAFGIPLGKMVMVFSYGDQITNLLQPFWALPLLAITGVSASQIFKYSFWLFLVGFCYLIMITIFLF